MSGPAASRSFSESSGDLSRHLREHRNLIVQELAEDLSRSKEEVINSVKELLSRNNAMIEGQISQCLEAVSKVPEEVEKRIAASSTLGKRPSRQIQKAASVPGLLHAVTKSRITWALSLHILRGLVEDFDISIDVQAGSRVADGRTSTLARFLFAIQYTEKKALHGSLLGRDSSNMVRDGIAHLFWSARRGSLFRRGSTSEDFMKEPMPDWLATHTLSAARKVKNDECFGPKDSDGVTIETRTAADIVWVEERLSPAEKKELFMAENDMFQRDISAIVAEAESYKVDFGRNNGGSSKRPRTSDQGLTSRDNSSEVFREAIRSTRSIVVDHLTTGRTGARDCAFRLFGFVLEVLRGVENYPSDGFSIELPDPEDQETVNYSDKTALTRIIGEPQLANAGMDEDELAEIDLNNSSSLANLSKKFPSLNCKITYVVSYHQGSAVSSSTGRNGHREVESTPGAPISPSASSPASRSRSLALSGLARNTDANSHTLRTSGAVKWTVTENLSLHSAALCFLYEAVRADSQSALLRSFPESFRAVHALALALRGLIKRDRGEEISLIESTILGEVYSSEKSWSESVAGRNERRADDNCGGGKRTFLLVMRGKDKQRQMQLKLERILRVSRKEYEEHRRSLQRNSSRREASVGRANRDRNFRNVDNDLELPAGL